MAEDRERGALLLQAHHVAKFHDGAVAGDRVRGDRRGERVLREREFVLRQGDGDLDRMTAFATIGVSDGHTGKIRLDRVVDILLLDPEEFELILVDGDAKPFGGRPEAVVHIDDEGDALEHFLELRRRRPPRFGVRPIDLGQERRKHGRPRRHFDNLQRGALGISRPRSFSRTSSAISWLVRERSDLGVKLSCRSPCSGPPRR